MDMTAGQLFAMLVFGAIGAGYFIYGWKQRRPVPLAVGLALSVYPFFVTNVWLVCLIGSGLCTVPWWLKIGD